MEKKWSELGKYQEDFAITIAKLILWAHENGIAVRMKDSFRDPRLHGEFGVKKGYGAADSVHKLSLAQDLYAKNDLDHVRLHDQWDNLGGAPRIKNDMNHYSFEWNGNW